MAVSLESRMSWFKGLILFGKNLVPCDDPTLSVLWSLSLNFFGFRFILLKIVILICKLKLDSPYKHNEVLSTSILGVIDR